MKKVVTFLIHPNDGDLFAYFPDDNYSDSLYGDAMKTCYSHIGQHSGCAVEYAKECRKATPRQYKALRIELESIGYDLDIQ